MPLPLRDFVNQVLLENDRAGKIYNAVARAWNLCIEKYPERATWVRKSTFRGLVWEAAIRELKAIELIDPDFKFVPHYDTASFIIENAVLFRFKYADMTLATTNYPTPQAVAFDDHESDLYGFAGYQRVELCYVLNEFETDLVWVGIAARSQGEHLWKIELTSDGVLAPQAELPMFDDKIDTAKLVKLKSTPPVLDSKKKKDNG